MGKTSVVINTLNEEKNLPRALDSVKNFADEIVICDMYSDDKTVEIAKKYGAEIYQHTRTGYVEPARNFAIGKATSEWVLILDADEEISKSLSLNLRKIVKNPKADYYRIPRKNIIFGRWIKHSRWWPDYNIRFFKKGYVSWSEIIHAVPITKGKGLDIEATEVSAIIHHNYDSIEQFIERMNRYTSQQAKNLAKEGYEFVWSDLISKPGSEFFSRYFQGEGYKDGLHGLALAGLQAVSEFVLYLKAWQSSKFEQRTILLKEVVRKMQSVESDAHYWQADALLKVGGGFKERIKRRFKLS